MIRGTDASSSSSVCLPFRRMLQFSVPDKFFKAPANEPENACFCTQRDMTHPLCATDGLLDISRCKKGAPIVLSAPHFFKGDYKLREDVRGLEPEKQKHETFLEIEPVYHPMPRRILFPSSSPSLLSVDRRCPERRQKNPNQRQRQEYPRL